ncbi:MAG: deoxyribodipyrimidine photolyase [Candidatus Fonsibacter ubiquis]|nr:deoxyribodipyrimidine photolyase [Candidatus Fonsibacter ubiquis]
MNLREQGIAKLKEFSENHLSNYAKSRNFDYGPSKRDNVSNLSKYITHRIIDEQEVIQTAHSKFAYIKIEKFIQEVFWRTYWKGWLEMRPRVWTSYIEDLKQLEKQKDSVEYQQAISGKTSIECFNDWANELIKYNYLHNHARMWFASIWIFTLKLPWQLGADFFLKHLLDGDAASNTLSWRWVAGLQTKGKNYLATKFNINTFSAKKYEVLKLNDQASPLFETTSFEIQPLHFDKVENDNSLFLLHNLDSNFLQKFQNKYQYYALLDFNSILESKNYSKQVLDFKASINEELIDQLKSNFNSDLVVKNKEDLLKIVKDKNIKNIITPYINCGYENDFMNEIKKKIKITYLARDYDQFCYPFATKGFFAFKEQIPKILSKIL